METNSGSSQPYTGLALVPLETYGCFMNAGLRGRKKAQGNLRIKTKQDRKTTNLSFPQFARA